jgi:hypothetical protein
MLQPATPIIPGFWRRYSVNNTGFHRGTHVCSADCLHLLIHGFNRMSVVLCFDHQIFVVLCLQPSGRRLPLCKGYDFLWSKCSQLCRRYAWLSAFHHWDFGTGGAADTSNLLNPTFNIPIREISLLHSRFRLP